MPTETQPGVLASHSALYRKTSVSLGAVVENVRVVTLLLSVSGRNTAAPPPEMSAVRVALARRLALAAVASPRTAAAVSANRAAAARRCRIGIRTLLQAFGCGAAWLAVPEAGGPSLVADRHVRRREGAPVRFRAYRATAHSPVAIVASS